jgi:prepilin-type N-terminal cleavage/methylation domain-containing protein
MYNTGERGFTITELLVTMVIASSILAGALTVYRTNLTIYRAQDQVLDAQENLRVALEMLVDDIQAAGGTGIPTAATVTVINSSTDSDSLTLVIPDSSVCPSMVQPISIISHTGGASGNLFLATGTSCAAMAGRLAIAVTADGLNYYTIRIATVTTGTDKVTFASGAAPLNSTAGSAADYTGGTLVFIRERTYTIDLTNPALPVLVRNENDGSANQAIANDIEDFQVSLGYDRNNDGIISEVGASADDDEWTFNVAGESNTAEASTNLREVKISLVARSKLQDPTFQGARPSIFDRSAGATDAYRRKSGATRIRVRNLGA